MTTILKSWLSGAWHEGSGRTSTLVDPTTEAVLAESSTEGLDFRGALEFAREKGGAALRAMTFAERGALLHAMGSSLHARREELVDLAIKNGGNTRGDAKFDIDGCTGTLFFYAKLGEKLGDARYLCDGEPTRLSRSPRFVGRHVYTPLTGAAVHVNAFNFPGWGFGEKAAVALLAGMPVVTKPATSTALLTARIIEILVEDGVLPEGAVSFIAGSPGDLLDHLSAGDVLAFTGSADTGYKLRSREHVLRQSIRVNVEADSLNSATLGPDVEPGSDTWDLFIREVAKDVTQKAGQKCTAIRRVFVPRERQADVLEALREEVTRVKVGDPSLKEVRMGPVATRQQLDDVRAGIERLKEQATPVLGDGGRGELVGIEGDQGYFVAPVLFSAADSADVPLMHEHEVFGPVATVAPHGGAAADVVREVRRGQGCLVSSLYTDDKAFAAKVLLGLAPWHGRLHLGSARVAEHSLGPGTVLPQLAHGGPGRAGGGEELGGTRGMELYLQRTALQGDEPLLAHVLSEAVPQPD